MLDWLRNWEFSADLHAIMQQDLEIAVVQMSSSEDKHANWNTADRLVRQAADSGARFVVLPEYFNCLGDRRVMLREAEPLDGPTAKLLQELARTLHIVLVGGTFCEQSADPLRAHNTCLIINPSGAIQAVYRKLHLFDVDLPGRLTYCESSWLAPGSDVVISDVELSTPVDLSAATGSLAPSISTAPAICYDLRFPELFRRFADREVALVTVPAAFTKATGRDHWELLCRARRCGKPMFPRSLESNRATCGSRNVRTFPHRRSLGRSASTGRRRGSGFTRDFVCESDQGSPLATPGAATSTNVLNFFLESFAAIRAAPASRSRFHARSECSQNCNCFLPRSAF